MNKALIIGVNTYAEQTGLQGCLNDVEDIRKVLIDRAVVDAKDVVVLTDGDATKKAIMAELAALIGALAPGDTGYFHFSGHGVRVKSTDPEEPDGRDEAVCPYDFDWTPETTIVDNEVLTLLAGLRGDARLILTIDSCHSGDFARFAAVPNSRPRTLPPPDGRTTSRGPTRLGFRIASRAPNVTFASACSPWQTAADTAFGGRPNGAFTYYFVQQVLATAPETSLSDDIIAIEPSLRDFEMTPVAENGDVPYFPPAVRAANGNGKRGAVARAPLARIARAPVSTRSGSIVFEQAWHSAVLGQPVGVGMRITAQNGELTSYLSASAMGQTFASPPIRTSGNLMYPLSLGVLGLRLVLTVSDWTFAPQAIRFMLDLDLASDLTFVPRVHVAHVPVTIDLARLTRDLATADVTSPADVLALLTLQQMHDGGAGARGSTREAATMRGFRDPRIEVFASGVASWGPNWREDRVIRPFADRPRPDGITRHSVDIGPQRGSGNVYVVGWLSDQETDFDFILHMGNNFFGGWGDIDWRVQGVYADIDPFPRAVEPEDRDAPRSNGTRDAHGRSVSQLSQQG